MGSIYYNILLFLRRNSLLWFLNKCVLYCSLYIYIVQQNFNQTLLKCSPGERKLTFSILQLYFVHCDYSLLFYCCSPVPFIFHPFQNKTSNQKIKSLVQHSGSMQETPLWESLENQTIRTELESTLEKDHIAGGGHQQNSTQLFYLVRCPIILYVYLNI